MEVLLSLAVIGAFFYLVQRYEKSPAQVAARERERQRQAQIVCPHCQVPGQVTRTLVQRKRGVSGGKATGALITGGASMLATGLSRKQQYTHMDCGNCGTGWDVE